MVTITNNKETKIVTKGAYNSFYKPLGYTIEKSVKKEPVKVQDVKEEKKEIKATKTDETKETEKGK